MTLQIPRRMDSIVSASQQQQSVQCNTSQQLQDMRNDVEGAMLDPEYSLLQNFPSAPFAEEAGADHSLRTAPILTGDAFAVAGERVFPQRALLGRIIAQEVEGLPKAVVSPKLYINSNAPFSAVVCGVQASCGSVA